MKHEVARRHVVDLCLRLSERGYFAGTGGNLMLRIDKDLVAVTPSAWKRASSCSRGATW